MALRNHRVLQADGPGRVRLVEQVVVQRPEADRDPCLAQEAVLEARVSAAGCERALRTLVISPSDTS